MNLFRRKQANTETLKRLAEQGAALREMLQHPASAIVEQRLADEKAWVESEWRRLLEADEPALLDKRNELYAYLRALQLVEFILLSLPKQGWRAEDKLLAYAEREKVYAIQ